MSSSNDATPYTVPYTSVTSKRVGQGVVPASMQPSQDGHVSNRKGKGKQAATHQAPAVASASSSASNSHAMGESSAAAAHQDGDGGHPPDPVPARFASATTTAQGVSNTRPEGQHVHSSTMSGSGNANGTAHNAGAAAAAFGLDGQSDNYQLNMGSPTQGGSVRRGVNPSLLRELQAAQQENHQLRHALKFTQFTCHNFHQQLINVNLYNERLTNLVIRLDSKMSRIDPDIFVTLPDDVQMMMQDIRDQWKYQEWYKTFHPMAQAHNMASGTRARAQQDPLHYQTSDLSEGIGGLHIYNGPGYTFQN